MHDVVNTTHSRHDLVFSEFEGTQTARAQAPKAELQSSVTQANPRYGLLDNTTLAKRAPVSSKRNSRKIPFNFEKK